MMRKPALRLEVRLALLAAFSAALLPAAGRAAPKKDPFEGLKVRSKEYVVRRNPEAEEFSGNVHYEQRNRELKSDWAILERAKGRFHAKGSVWTRSRLESGDVIEARGHEARHDAATGKGSLLPREGGLVRFEHKGGPTANAPQGAEDEGTAKSMWWNEKESEVRLRGDVRMWGTEGRFWADEARYQHDARLLTLTGRRPVLSRKEPTWTGAIQADEIRGYQGRQRLEAQGKVQGWIYFKEKDKALKKR